MTNEEASEILEDFFYWVVFPRCNGKIFNHRKLEESIKMAIEALKQPKIIRCNDCEYQSYVSCEGINGGMCPDAYCSFAERKKSE